MRRLLRILVASFSVVMAIMSIASIWYRLNEARISGERSSGAEYSILRNALNSIQSDADLQDQVLRSRLQSLYKGSDRLMAVQVLDSGGLVVWKMPAESAYFALPNQESTRIGFSAPKWSTIVYSTPLSGNLKLVALYATVLKSDFAYSAKLPLLLVGIWFLLVCAASFFLRKDKISVPEISPTEIITNPEIPAVPEQGSEPEIEIPSEVQEEETEVDREALAVSESIEDIPVPSEPSALSQEPLQPESGNAFEDSLAKLEENVIEWSTRREEEQKPRLELVEDVVDEDELAGEDTEEIKDADADTDEETTLEDSLETLQEFEELNAEEENQPGPLAQSEPIAPIPPAPVELKKAVEPSPSPPPNDLTDLPMPLSLLEPGIESRLSQELSRSDKSEVSLMLIHCSITGPSDPAGIALASTMKDYIGSRELIFEMYKGAFAVILPSVDLGGALKMSEDLSDVLATTLGLYRDIEGDPPVYIGISARSERPIDAYKLYREASTAVHKAFSGGHSRILAFRPKLG